MSLYVDVFGTLASWLVLMPHSKEVGGWIPAGCSMWLELVLSLCICGGFLRSLPPSESLQVRFTVTTWPKLQRLRTDLAPALKISSSSSLHLSNHFIFVIFLNVLSLFGGVLSPSLSLPPSTVILSNKIFTF